MLKHVKIQKSYEQHFSIWHVYHDVEWDIIEYAIEAVAPHNAIFTEKCLLLMCKLVERKKRPIVDCSLQQDHVAASL